MYEREVLFFNEIATQLDTPKTHCYFAGFNADTGGNMVIIEDLHDYDVGDQVTGVAHQPSSSITSRRFTRGLMPGRRTSAISTPSIAMITSPHSPGFWGGRMPWRISKCFDNEIRPCRYVSSLVAMKRMGRTQTPYGMCDRQRHVWAGRAPASRHHDRLANIRIQPLQTWLG